MIPYTLTRNYDGYGGGHLSPGCQYFLINISKNASSYVTAVLKHNGWTAGTVGDGCDWHCVKKMIVILRDPVDRWCSGVAQYLYTKILNPVGPSTYIYDGMADCFEDNGISADAFLVAYSPLLERFIFNNLDLLDDHVWMQQDFFRDLLPTVPRHYIMMGDDVNQGLTDLGLEIPCVDRKDFNASEDNADKKLLKNFFQNRLQKKPSLLHKVKMSYAPDYELIRSIWPDYD